MVGCTLEKKRNGMVEVSGGQEKKSGIWNCPICGREASEGIFTHARLANIRRTYASKETTKNLMKTLNTELCRNCGMLYRKPLMSEEELKRYYEDSYAETYKESSEETGADDYGAKLPHYKKYYLKHFKYLRGNKIDFRGKRVLDIGCGTGWFLAVMKEHKPLYRLGIEPSKRRCSEIEGNKEFDFQVLNGCLRDFSRDKIGEFDIITLIGVFEHLSHPLADLEAIRFLMKDTSFLYISTHNESPALFTNINRRISLVHQLYFTPRTVRILLEKAGFRIVNLKIRRTDMHILAKKSESFVNSGYELNGLQYKMLKWRYLFCRNITRGEYEAV